MTSLLDAQPAPIAIDPRCATLVSIDMQRDCLKTGGSWESPGNDAAPPRGVIAGNRKQERA